MAGTVARVNDCAFDLLSSVSSPGEGGGWPWEKAVGCMGGSSEGDNGHL